MRWVLDNLSLVLAIAALLILARQKWPHPLRGFDVWKQRRRLRHWTSAGLNWRVILLRRDSLIGAIASLIITPVADSELPQPLEILITCLGECRILYSRFYADESRPKDDEDDTDLFPRLLANVRLEDSEDAHDTGSGDLEIERRRGKSLRVKLISPKLLPPAQLAFTLTSQANAEIKVLDVRRAP